jgi:hypothetical protein
MAADPHLVQLEKRHQELQARLDEILQHPSADDSEINELKRQKLAIKDRIQRLRDTPALH